MYISLRIRKRVMLCVIAVLSMLAAVAVMPTFAKEEKTDGIKLPIIMYHSIVKNEDRSGEYVLSLIHISFCGKALPSFTTSFHISAIAGTSSIL